MFQQTSADIDSVMTILARTYHGRGSVELGDPFKVLVATIISQRTREEDTTRISKLVFSRYTNAAALSAAGGRELAEMLAGSLYPETKSLRLIELAAILVRDYGGQVPDSVDALLALPGVGRKTANCVLIYAFQKPALCIDIHFHRITNRLGWIETKSPDQSERQLEKIIPREWWIGSNRLFLQHGRAVCLPTIPICSKCPVIAYCRYGNTAESANR